MGKLIDLTGQQFGYLTVIERAENNSSNKVQWKCKCYCGNETLVTSNNLKTGHTKSCGCFSKANKEHFGKMNFKDLTGQKFGKLKVLYLAEERDPNGNLKWHCQCDCGKEKDITAHALTSNNTLSCGCLKMSHGELKINQILKENNIDFIQEYRPEGMNKRYDFYIPSWNLLIEYDGKQHFTDKNTGWNEPLKEIQRRDREKNEWAQENGIALIRIPYTHYDDLSMEDLAPASSTFIINKKIQYIPRKH